MDCNSHIRNALMKTLWLKRLIKVLIAVMTSHGTKSAMETGGWGTAAESSRAELSRASSG